MILKDQSIPEMGWRIVVTDHYEAMSETAALWIAEEIRRRPDLLLCAATGASPTGAYRFLAGIRKSQPRLFEQARVLKLDEWGGLAMDDPATCEQYLRQHLVQPLGISADRYFTFDSQPEDPTQECERLRLFLGRHGPIDLCILGLGLNGHLAMNEPARSLQPSFHVAELTAATQQHPMLAQAKGEVRYGLTLGIGDILRSKKILLLVSGPHKRKPMEELLSQKISTEFPASFLWLHGQVTCICDESVIPQQSNERSR